MPKDRFSNQKPWNYSKEFRSGYCKVEVEKYCLTDKDKKLIKQVQKMKLNSWEIQFVKTLKQRNKILSLKQLKVLRDIVEHGKKREFKKVPKYTIDYLIN